MIKNIIQIICIIIIFLLSLIFSFFNFDNIDIDNIKGGKERNSPSYNKRMYIDNNNNIIIDGHNMIHDLAKDIIINDNIYKKCLLHISEILLLALPNQNIKIVIKNNKLNKKKYFNIIKNISKKYPMFEYHIAYGKDGNKHFLKGRDDFLAIYLLNNGYIISKDRFRDFKFFNKIKPFIHYKIYNGIIEKLKKIDPKYYYKKIEYPTSGKHFIYYIGSYKEFKKLNVKNGNIYYEKENSTFPKIYLSDLNFKNK